MAKAHSHALILFARDPVPGQVKTRLHPFLDTETIYRLYLCFLKDSIDKICSVEETGLFIGLYPSNLSGYFDRLKTDRPVEIFNQQGKDLGEKMKNAFSRMQEDGYERTVIIGSDSPSLPVSYIQLALDSRKGLVLGPSSDGGYYLIGMGRKRVDVFAGVAWGTENVLKETLDRARKQECETQILPLWYDVDTPEDLKFLQTHLEWVEHSGAGETGASGDFLSKLVL